MLYQLSHVRVTWNRIQRFPLGRAKRPGPATDLARNMTILQKYRGAILDTITSFVNNPKMTPQEAADAMADAVEAQK